MAFSLPEWPGARAGSEEGELFSQARLLEKSFFVFIQYSLRRLLDRFAHLAI